MARHHCRLARAFAVNPSRLPARPSGLWGIDRSARQAKGAAVPSMQNCAPRELSLKLTKRRNADRKKKRLDTRPHISGCKSHPANAAAGSNRSSYGGNEVAEAFD